MWSRRDQLQAYQFLRRRLVSAVLVGDANHPESPSKRSVMTTVTGIVVTLLVMAGFTVWGAFKPGASKRWEDAKYVIVERESGTRFVLDNKNVLHEALNYSSAALFVGISTKDPKDSVISVSRKSLRSATRGQPIGIVGAPEALPAPAALLPGRWRVCTRTGVGSAAAAAGTTVNVTVGADEPRDALLEDRGLVVQAAGRTFLVSGGEMRAGKPPKAAKRFEIASTKVAKALGYDRTETHLPVAQAWLDAIPAGPRLQFLTVPGAGEPGPSIGGRTLRVGQVIDVTRPSGHSYYLVRREGAALISQTEALLHGGNPDLPSVPMTPSEASGLPPAPLPGTDSGFPLRLPQVPDAMNDTVAVCVTVGAGASGLPQLTLDDQPEIHVPVGAPGAGQGRADDVSVPRGAARSCVPE